MALGEENLKQNGNSVLWSLLTIFKNKNQRDVWRWLYFK